MKMTLSAKIETFLPKIRLLTSFKIQNGSHIKIQNDCQNMFILKYGFSNLKTVYKILNDHNNSFKMALMGIT